MATTDRVRRPGRPDQQASEELVRHIVAVAARLFIDQGFAATSIDQIAAAAGSGKQTIYRRFGSKDRLFSEVVNASAQRNFEVAEVVGSSSPDAVVALRQTCRQLFDFALAADAVQLRRILVAECVRFPDLGVNVLENTLKPFHTLLQRLLTQAMDAGQLRRMDPELAHRLLANLFMEGPVQYPLLGARAFKTPADREAYFDAAWELYLGGMAQPS